MRYEEPKMLISMFDDEDDILTASPVAESYGLGEFNSASDAAKNDLNGADTTYSINVETFQ